MRKLVTVEEVLEKKPIVGADRIEALRVREWWVVAVKDQFKVGDKCMFFEIDSFLPDKPEYEFLKKGSTLKRMTVDGKVLTGIRLKTIKLRGQISQGLVMPILDQYKDSPIGTDITEEMGVRLYEIPIPAQLQGTVKGFFPSFIPKTDEERIQNMAYVLSGYYVSEKIDGSSVTFYKKDGVFGVCSRNLELKENDGSQWTIAKKYDLVNKLPEGMALQCEIVGPGIQKNPLQLPAVDIYCFNVYKITDGMYLNYYDFKGMCESLGVKTVPIIDEHFTLPKSVSEMVAYADGNSLITPTVLREGVVVRPKWEMKIKQGQRFSFKAISNEYLMKNEI